MPHGRADEIVHELTEILTGTRDHANLAPLPAGKLTETLALVRDLEDRLVDLQLHVVLDEHSQDDEDMDATRRLWDLVPADRDTHDVGALVSASPTLTALHKAAVTIRSLHRFSDERVRIATVLGEALAQHPQYVGLLCARTSDARPSFSIAADAAPGVARALRALTEAGAISGFRVQGLVRPKNGKNFWKDRDKVPAAWGLQQWRVLRGTVAPAWASFLKGDWLTAFAYGIAYDQFVRAGAPFEIYAKVQYQLPADLGGGRSDIDVLVRTADVLFCIECKSGRVLVSHHGGESAALKTLRNAERLDALLDQMGVGLARTYQLLYLCPPGEEPDAVRVAVEGGGVPLLVTTPSDERRIIQRAALRQEPDDHRTPAAPGIAGTWLKTTSAGSVLRITLHEDGALTERREFADPEDAWSGRWSERDGQVRLDVAGWQADLKPESDVVLSGTETGPGGTVHRVLLVRLP